MRGLLKTLIAFFVVMEGVVGNNVSSDAEFIGVCILLAGFIVYKED